MFDLEGHQHMVIAVSICTNNSFCTSILSDQEIHRLKMGMETLLVANEDKVRGHCDTLSLQAPLTLFGSFWSLLYWTMAYYH